MDYDQAAVDTDYTLKNLDMKARSEVVRQYNIYILVDEKKYFLVNTFAQGGMLTEYKYTLYNMSTLNYNEL